VTDQVCERANHHHGALVAGFAATAHWCLAEIAMVKHLHESMVHQ
jgi:hypothetical protein